MIYFVVMSGVPGSGKSTIARQLAPALGLSLLDKDTILERLFELKGTGDRVWRSALSRESDRIFQQEASASNGAVLVSHWHLAGMPEESGTPTAWLAGLAGRIVNVHCACDSAVAAQRFVQRKRHPGHLDAQKSQAEILSGICAIAKLGRLEIGLRVEVDTSKTLDLAVLLRSVSEALR